MDSFYGSFSSFDDERNEESKAMFWIACQNVLLYVHICLQMYIMCKVE
jgi:hypothetical protein